MLVSMALVKKLDRVDGDLKDVLWGILEEVERNREESVTKKEFYQLTEIVSQLGQSTSELSEAQKRTEVRLEELTGRVGELAVSQKELSEAQKRTEIRLEELAEAQKRTEIRLEELAVSQKRTEVRLEELTGRVGELAVSQKRTEEELRTLVSEHKETRRQLGGLSMTVGYGLEDKAYPALPALLRRDFDLDVQGELERDYINDNKGNPIEVNIFGKAVAKDGREVTIIGESKSQLSKNDVNDFIRKRLNRFQGVFEEIFPIIITFMTSSPDVKNYVREKGIALYYSYHFEKIKASEGRSL